MAALKTKDVGEVLVVYFTDAKILDEARIQQIGKELMEMNDFTGTGVTVINEF